MDKLLEDCTGCYKDDDVAHTDLLDTLNAKGKKVDATKLYDINR